MAHRVTYGPGVPQLENLFTRDHAFAGGHRSRQAVQQRRLPRLRPAGDEGVEPSDDAGVEEPRRLWCQRFETHQVVEMVARTTNLRTFTARPSADLRVRGEHGCDLRFRYSSFLAVDRRLATSRGLSAD
jgi:hypothetical protein